MDKEEKLSTRVNHIKGKYMNTSTKYDNTHTKEDTLPNIIEI
jgi:hypothetical protein